MWNRPRKFRTRGQLTKGYGTALGSKNLPLINEFHLLLVYLEVGKFLANKPLRLFLCGPSQLIKNYRDRVLFYQSSIGLRL